MPTSNPRPEILALILRTTHFTLTKEILIDTFFIVLTPIQEDHDEMSETDGVDGGDRAVFEQALEGSAIRHRSAATERSGLGTGTTPREPRSAETTGSPSPRGDPSNELLGSSLASAIPSRAKARPQQ